MGLTVLVPSFLTSWLRRLGPVLAPRASAAFLEGPGRYREVFLPFFYRWSPKRAWVADHALRVLRLWMHWEGFLPPRVFHAPFSGRYGRVVTPTYYRDLADPRLAPAHIRELKEECAFLGAVRRAFGISGPMLYVVHLGLRRGRSGRESLRVATAALAAVLDAAQDAGVILGIENVADQAGDLQLGCRLEEIGEALTELRGGAVPGAPFGWVFDISHALIGHHLRWEEVQRAVQLLLPSLVHLHVNGIDWEVARRGGRADYHYAPAAEDEVTWTLLREALRAPRLHELGAVTYEVSWRVPFASLLFGGSRLRDIVRGYALLQEEILCAGHILDNPLSQPYALGRPVAVAIAPGQKAGTFTTDS